MGRMKKRYIVNLTDEGLTDEEIVDEVGGTAHRGTRPQAALRAWD